MLDPINWRAGCVNSARPVRREGELPLSLPLSLGLCRCTKHSGQCLGVRADVMGRVRERPNSEDFRNPVCATFEISVMISSTNGKLQTNPNSGESQNLFLLRADNWELPV